MLNVVLGDSLRGESGVGTWGRSCMWPSATEAQFWGAVLSSGVLGRGWVAGVLGLGTKRHFF